MIKTRRMRSFSISSGFLFLLVGVISAQSLPIDFESSITTSTFVDFDGGTATVLPNPFIDTDNPSSTVARIVRNGGQVYAGSKIELSQNLDFSAGSTLRMKVYSTAPVGTIIKFKLESGSNSAERDVPTNVSGAWEEISWDFTGTPANFNTIVFMFDFGNVGNGAANSTFYFDDIRQIDTGLQLDLPVDFQQAGVNYALTDFGGTASRLVQDPQDASNQVAQVVKTVQAQTWAGTTIGTNAGFATTIPLSLTDSKMNVRVWSPAAGTPIRLKVEDSTDPRRTCETQTNTTVAGEWEVLTFDFTNQAPGTESLSVGLSMGWTYNMASIFFNYGTTGSVAGEQTYYFDDVMFGDQASTVKIMKASDIELFPNPTLNDWEMQLINGERILKIIIRDSQGREVLSLKPENSNALIPSTGMVAGVYFAQVFTSQGVRLVSLVKN